MRRDHPLAQPPRGGGLKGRPRVCNTDLPRMSDLAVPLPHMSDLTAPQFINTVCTVLKALFLRELAVRRASAGQSDTATPDDNGLSLLPPECSEQLRTDLLHAARVLANAWYYPGEPQARFDLAHALT